MLCNFFLKKICENAFMDPLIGYFTGDKGYGKNGFGRYNVCRIEICEGKVHRHN